MPSETKQLLCRPGNSRAHPYWLILVGWMFVSLSFIRVILVVAYPNWFILVDIGWLDVCIFIFYLDDRSGHCPSQIPSLLVDISRLDVFIKDRNRNVFHEIGEKYICTASSSLYLCTAYSSGGYKFPTRWRKSKD